MALAEMYQKIKDVINDMMLIGGQSHETYIAEQYGYGLSFWPFPARKQMGAKENPSAIYQFFPLRSSLDNGPAPFGKANLNIVKPDERASGCPTGPPSYIDVTKSCDFAPPPTSRPAHSLLVCILINVITPCKLSSGQLDNIMSQAKNSTQWQPQPSLMLPSRNQHKFLLVVLYARPRTEVTYGPGKTISRKSFAKEREKFHQMSLQSVRSGRSDCSVLIALTN
jgi:hypothetical protein